MPSLPRGLYEELITEALEAGLQQVGALLRHCEPGTEKRRRSNLGVPKPDSRDRPTNHQDHDL